MTLTKHAAIRAQQRCIPPLVVEWLLAYGRRQSSRGAVQITFDKKARRELARDVGKPVVGQVGKLLNASLIVDPQTDRVITVMWQH